VPASTETAALLKRVYDESLGNMIYTNRPLFGKFTKKKGGGSVVEQVVVYGEGAGRSRVAATAVANKGRSKKAKFLVPFGENYHTASVSSLDQSLTANLPKSAFADALALEIETSIDTLANDAELGLIRAKGVRGKIATGGISSATITLEYRGDAKNFYPGMRTQWSATAGAALRNSGAVGTVLSVNEGLGTVTYTAAIASIGAAIAAGDVIYQEGDGADGGAEKGTLSLEDWIPLTDPTPGESFAGGVDRTVSMTKLSGVRMDLRGYSARETMLRLASRIGESEGAPDFCLAPFSFWETLALELGSTAETEMMGTGNAANFGYRALKYVGPNTTMMVVPHAKMPGDRVYQLTSADWTLDIAGGGLDPVENPLHNGKVRDTGFGVDIEHQSILYLRCRKPGKSGVARIA
jgi:hypothetical protein